MDHHAGRHAPARWCPGHPLLHAEPLALDAADLRAAPGRVPRVQPVRGSGFEQGGTFGRMTVDLDEVLTEVRARIQQKRASGEYGPDVEAALHAPLPGGPALLVDDLQDPLGSLAGVLATPVEYDHRSRKRYVGRAITAARGVVMGLVRWWINAITERQERINRLVAAGLQELSARPSPEFGARLDRIERLLETRQR